MKKILQVVLASGALCVMAEVETKEKEMTVEPRIVVKQFLLVGVESEPIDFQTDFTPILNGLYQRVREKLDAVYGRVAEPVRMVGFWQPRGVYFAGVELLLDLETVPEGLIMKKLPESLYAVFEEQRRGTMGGPQGGAYQWLLGSSMFEHNGAIAGDFEIYKNLHDTAPDCEAEILIPIKVKNTFRNISEAKAFQKEFEIFVVPPSRVIGKEVIVPSNVENPIPAFWQKLIQTDDWKTMQALPRVIPESGFGWTCDWVEATRSFSYLCSTLTPAGTPVPEGFQFRDVPQTLAAVGKFGEEIGEIVERLKGMGFETAWGDAGCGWNAELYFDAEQENPPLPKPKVEWRWVVPCKQLTVNREQLTGENRN